MQLLEVCEIFIQTVCVGVNFVKAVKQKKKIIMENNIPDQLVINWDQTGMFRKLMI